MSKFLLAMFFIFNVISCMKINEPQIEGSLSIKVPEATTPEARDWRDNYSRTYFYSTAEQLVGEEIFSYTYYIDNFANILCYKFLETNHIIISFHQYYFKTMKNYSEAYYYRTQDLSKKLSPILSSTNTIPKNMSVREHSLFTIITNKNNTLSLLEYNELTEIGEEILSNFYYQNFEKDEITGKLTPFENMNWKTYTNMYNELMPYIDTTKTPIVLGTSSNL